MDNLQKGSSLNTLKKGYSPKHSKFPIQKPLAFTPRFGELYPYFAEDVVPDDKLKVQSLFDLRTYTLKSPLMQDIAMYKSSFYVPISAILPNNWDKVVETPNIGEKCPIEASTLIKLSDFYNFFSNVFYVYSNISENQINDRIATDMFRLLAISHQLFSSQGLIKAFGLPVNCDFDYSVFSWDVLFDDLLMDDTGSIEGRFIVYPYNGDKTDTLFTLKSKNSFDFLYWLQDYSGEIVGSSASAVVTALKSTLDTIARSLDTLAVNSADLSNFYVDLSRIFAYQLVYNEYFTNDNVDYIYSAKSWRSAMQGLSILLSSAVGVEPYFEFNGDKVAYDALSTYIFSAVANVSSTSVLLNDYIVEYICQIFGLRRSLVYKDYFTNARVSPLAVGDTSVSVNNNKVDVVNVTRSIQVQRFLNAINRAGRKPANYFKSLLDVNIKLDDDTPIFLHETKDIVYSTETENTSNAQQSQPNSITSRLQTKSNKFSFTTYCDKYGIVLSLVSFEVERFYDHSSERQTLKQSLFDYFNPFMQYIGDQPIYNVERSTSIRGDLALSPFGYVTRDMQYKLSFPRAIGGFVDQLPTWLFKASNPIDVEDDFNFINPETIRSLPSCLDEFYLSINRSTLNEYFHFIVLSRQFVEANRPMVKNPQILG